MLHVAILPDAKEADPAAIKLKHLQLLARHWKLHHDKSFWKKNRVRRDLIHTLYEHAELNHLLHDASAAAARDLTEQNEPTAPEFSTWS